MSRLFLLEEGDDSFDVIEGESFLIFKKTVSKKRWSFAIKKIKNLVKAAPFFKEIQISLQKGPSELVHVEVVLRQRVLQLKNALRTLY